jgi:hypothetical protein
LAHMSETKEHIIAFADSNTTTIIDALDKGGDTSDPRIRCPLCGWSPRKEDHWSCSCGYAWNTFDTGGVCPACLHQWTTTECLACTRWYDSCRTDKYDFR